MARPAARVAAALAAATALLAPSSRAIGPHEVALVVNDASVESVVLGAVWARLRSIPQSNVVRVSIPPGPDGNPPEAITREDFNRLIYKPVSEELNKRDEARRIGVILAWAYSCGMPARVTASESGLRTPSTNDLSLAGATFLRGSFPEGDEAATAAEYVSPLYAGPDARFIDGTNMVPVGFSGPANSFDRRVNELLNRMPLPSFMLAWTGAHGLSLTSAVEAIERSAAADRTAPTGTIAFVRRKDVRDAARAWQYGPVVDNLEALSRDVFGSVTEVPPDASSGPIVGYMTGAAEVSPMPALAPGAYADHFTSYAAAFARPTQTKAVRWLESGAAFSSGTVCEPFAIWAKFPTAWIFPRLVSGATAIEAFFASVRCPLQIQPIGDPLCAPWAPEIKPEIEVKTQAAEPFGDQVSLSAVLTGDSPDVSPDDVKFYWFVDNRQVGSGRELKWDAGAEQPGPHEVRLVARLQNTHERPQGFVVRTFETTARAEALR